jgi:hypothetical protein
MTAEPQAFLCTDLDAAPLDILPWFVRRWVIEVTFAEVRRHLGVETQLAAAIPPAHQQRLPASPSAGQALRARLLGRAPERNGSAHGDRRGSIPRLAVMISSNR